MGERNFSLRLIGPLRLLRDDGADVTPGAAKARGMLALLGTSSGLRRTRPWLQDKLWSESDPEHGAANMRQTLARMRLALGADASCLLTGPNWIGLDPARVSVVLQPDPADWSLAGEPPEFCEDVDIADPEFEDWIRDQRSAIENRLAEPAKPAPRALTAGSLRPAAPSAGTVLIAAASQVDDPGLLPSADVLCSHIAAQVARMGGIEVRLEAAGAAAQPSGDALRLQMRACRFGDRAIFQARLTDPVRGTLLWTGNREMSLVAAVQRETSQVAAFVAEVASASSLELGRGGAGETGAGVRACYRALRDVLSFDSATLARCDRVFATTTLANGRGAAQNAWRAHLRLISLIERIAPHPEESRDEAIEFATRALEADPLNPIVNALASDVALHIEARPAKALQLALTAVEQDAFNPFAHASLAQALARAGDVRKAHSEALRALRLSTGQPNPSWWHMRCSVTAVRTGRFEEAMRHAQTAHELSPNFKPPLRFLAALRYFHGDDAGAAQALRELKQMEPDFSLELMASDEYPLATIRNTSLMNVVRSALV